MGSMKQWFKRLIANAGVLGDFLVFLWKRKMWWLIPMVLTLLVCGLLLVFASSTGLGPFIYSLF
jgi:drug/metabolite transporter superfamily protein YnfA